MAATAPSRARQVSAAASAKPVPTAATPGKTNPSPPAITAKAPMGQSLARAARVGLPIEGRLVAVRAWARAGRIASAARAGRPRIRPPTRAIVHHTAATIGVSVSLDPVKGKVAGNPGEYAWGGAASTAFWIDPVDDLTVAFYTQLLPSSVHPIRRQLKQLVYQSLL